MNVMSGIFSRTAAGAQVQIGNQAWPVDASVPATDGQAVSYGVRPGDLHLSDDGQGIAAKVVVVEPTGAETELLLQVGDHQLTLVMHGRTGAQPDDMVRLSVDAAKTHLFDAASGKRLG
jgi:multiple sugar transport system ATP-binding protein